MKRAALARPAAVEADPFGFDAEVQRTVLPLFRFLYERYWRVEVDGIEHVPVDGPALLVANHSGAIPFDAAMIGCALQFEAPQPRLVRFLFDRFVTDMPLVGELYTKLGSVEASSENAEVLLERGDLVGIFPEGVAGVAKGFTRRYRLQAFRSGFARLSLRTGAPVVPVAVVGAEETYPVLGKWQRLGPLKALLGVPYVPLTPLFPWLGPLGAIPLPSRWHIRFGAPIHLARRRRGGRDAPRQLAEDVRRRIQGMLHEVLAQRESLF